MRKKSRDNFWCPGCRVLCAQLADDSVCARHLASSSCNIFSKPVFVSQQNVNFAQIVAGRRGDLSIVGSRLFVRDIGIVAKVLCLDAAVDHDAQCCSDLCEIVIVPWIELSKISNFTESECHRIGVYV